jgi:hypothetical protein
MLVGNCRASRVIADFPRSTTEYGTRRISDAAAWPPIALFHGARSEAAGMELSWYCMISVAEDDQHAPRTTGDSAVPETISQEVQSYSVKDYRLRRECRDRLHEFLSVGLDEPIIGISGPAEARKLALELVRDVTASRR